MNVALSILKGVVEDLGDVLVAVVGVEEVEAPKTSETFLLPSWV